MKGVVLLLGLLLCFFQHSAAADSPLPPSSSSSSSPHSVEDASTDKKAASQGENHPPDQTSPPTVVQSQQINTTCLCQEPDGTEPIGGDFELRTVSDADCLIQDTCGGSCITEENGNKGRCTPLVEESVKLRKVFAEEAQQALASITCLCGPYLEESNSTKKPFQPLSQNDSRLEDLYCLSIHPKTCSARSCLHRGERGSCQVSDDSPAAHNRSKSAGQFVLRAKALTLADELKRVCRQHNVDDPTNPRAPRLDRDAILRADEYCASLPADQINDQVPCPGGICKHARDDEEERRALHARARILAGSPKNSEWGCYYFNGPVSLSLQASSDARCCDGTECTLFKNCSLQKGSVARCYPPPSRAGPFGELEHPLICSSARQSLAPRAVRIADDYCQANKKLGAVCPGNLGSLCSYPSGPQEQARAHTAYQRINLNGNAYKAKYLRWLCYYLTEEEMDEDDNEEEQKLKEEALQELKPAADRYCAQVHRTGAICLNPESAPRGLQLPIARCYGPVADDDQQQPRSPLSKPDVLQPVSLAEQTDPTNSDPEATYMGLPGRVHDGAEGREALCTSKACRRSLQPILRALYEALAAEARALKTGDHQKEHGGNERPSLGRLLLVLITASPGAAMRYEPDIHKGSVVLRDETELELAAWIARAVGFRTVQKTPWEMMNEKGIDYLLPALAKHGPTGARRVVLLRRPYVSDPKVEPNMNALYEDVLHADLFLMVEAESYPLAVHALRGATESMEGEEWIVRRENVEMQHRRMHGDAQAAAAALMNSALMGGEKDDFMGGEIIRRHRQAGEAPPPEALRDALVAQMGALKDPTSNEDAEAHLRFPSRGLLQTNEESTAEPEGSGANYTGVDPTPEMSSLTTGNSTGNSTGGACSVYGHSGEEMSGLLMTIIGVAFVLLG